MVSETLRENLSLYTMLIYDTSLIKIHLLLLIHRIEEISQLNLLSPRRRNSSVSKNFYSDKINYS